MNWIDVISAGPGAADMLIQAVEEETRARGARAVRVAMTTASRV